MKSLNYDLCHDLLTYASKYYPIFLAKLLKFDKSLLPIATYLIKRNKINYTDLKFKHYPISVNINDIIKYCSLTTIKELVKYGLVIEFEHLLSAMESKDFEKANYIFNNYYKLDSISESSSASIIRNFITQDFKFIKLNNDEYHKFMKCLLNNVYILKEYTNRYRHLEITMANYQNFLNYIYDDNNYVLLITIISHILLNKFEYFIDYASNKIMLSIIYNISKSDNISQSCLNSYIRHDILGLKTIINKYLMKLLKTKQFNILHRVLNYLNNDYEIEYPFIRRMAKYGIYHSKINEEYYLRCLYHYHDDNTIIQIYDQHPELNEILDLDEGLDLKHCEIIMNYNNHTMLYELFNLKHNPDAEQVLEYSLNKQITYDHLDRSVVIGRSDVQQIILNSPIDEHYIFYQILLKYTTLDKILETNNLNMITKCICIGKQFDKVEIDKVMQTLLNIRHDSNNNDYMWNYNKSMLYILLNILCNDDNELLIKYKSYFKSAFNYKFLSDKVMNVSLPYSRPILIKDFRDVIVKQSYDKPHLAKILDNTEIYSRLNHIAIENDDPDKLYNFDSIEQMLEHQATNCLQYVIDNKSDIINTDYYKQLAWMNNNWLKQLNNTILYRYFKNNYSNSDYEIWQTQ